MKKLATVICVALFAVILVPVLSHAALQRSFTMGTGIGGSVTSIPTDLQATIVCTAAYGPFIMRPYNTAVPGPYFIRVTNRGTPRRNGNVLALYNTVPDTGTCYNPETGVPVPAFEIKLYGTSR
jgi:hypothetical protein